MFFSCPISEKKEVKIEVKTSISQVDEKRWDAIVNGDNLYLSTRYLSALEKSLDSVDFRYLLFFKNKKLVGLASVQIVNLINQSKEYGELFCSVGDKIKDKFIASLNIRVMTCGNVFSTGENGFAHTDAISEKEFYLALSKGLKELSRNKELNGNASIILLKEFWPQSFKKGAFLKPENYRGFSIDVNMILKIHPQWKSIDDYLQSMVTKFRTKAKSVFKKSASITSRNLTAEDIENHKAELEQLYQAVLHHADFKFGELNGEAFLQLKNNLNGQFLVTGYFKENKLVGFSSGFLFGDVLDANYVGFDYDLNHKYALYQRMLYDFVEMAINMNCSELRLGRTAEELKSGLGAEPVNMKLFMRHRNSLSNKLLKPFVERISPHEYELRKPFKASFSYN